MHALLQEANKHKEDITKGVPAAAPAVAVAAVRQSVAAALGGASAESASQVCALQAEIRRLHALLQEANKHKEDITKGVPAAAPAVAAAAVRQSVAAALGGASAASPQMFDISSDLDCGSEAATTQTFDISSDSNDESEEPVLPEMPVAPPEDSEGEMDLVCRCTPAMPEPAITVCVEGMAFQYQLVHDDPHQLFMRYGYVKKICLYEATTRAIMIFDQIRSAQACIDALNGKVPTGLRGTMRVNWAGSPAMALSAELEAVRQDNRALFCLYRACVPRDPVQVNIDI